MISVLNVLVSSRGIILLYMFYYGYSIVDLLWECNTDSSFYQGYHYWDICRCILVCALCSTTKLPMCLCSSWWRNYWCEYWCGPNVLSGGTYFIQPWWLRLMHGGTESIPPLKIKSVCFSAAQLLNHLHECIGIVIYNIVGNIWKLFDSRQRRSSCCCGLVIGPALLCSSKIT